MTGRAAFNALILAVALERTAEIVVSRRNARRLRRRGGREHGAGHYPAMVALHAGLLAGAAIEARLCARPPPRRFARAMLAAVAMSQGLRWWCIATLGRRWCTRVIVVPAPLVRRGPYRWLRHPNYLAVAIEGAALPLSGGAWLTAALFTLLNGALLRVRIGCEDRALAAAEPR